MEKESQKIMHTNNIFFPVIVLIFITLNTLHADQKTVVLQVNESAPIWSKKLPSNGMGGEIVQAISKEMGMKTHIEFIPLKRLIADTTNNDIGNPLFYMNNQEFAGVIPIAVSYSSLFSYQNPNNISSQDEPQVKRVGVLQGTLTSKDISPKFGYFEESKSQRSLFKKLKAGRLDLVVELNLVGQEMIQHLFPKEAKRFHVEHINKSNSAIAILIDIDYPNAKSITLDYQEGLDRIIKNGTYQKILEKYHENGTIPSTWYRNLSKFKALYGVNFEGDD